MRTVVVLNKEQLIEEQNRMMSLSQRLTARKKKKKKYKKRKSQQSEVSQLMIQENLLHDKIETVFVNNNNTSQIPIKEMSKIEG